MGSWGRPEGGGGEETEEKERMGNEKLAKAEYAWQTSELVVTF